MKRFIAIWILLSAGLNIWQMDRIRNLEEKKPMVIYKADNQGAEIKGRVVEKGRHGKLYTLTIRDYGVFVVTKEVYDNVKVGKEVKL
ncbi:DUF1372 family protein [Streptococcus sp. 27098_8_69]|uniref:DUF1372 family protein n=1 Tax=Streptococcus sp. 27098_8_69 TaxID=3003664 RepID=UPI00352D65A7